MKKGDVVELVIEKFADRGKSLTRVDGYVVFVDGAVPGDRVRARVIRRKRSHAEARVEEIIEASTLRTEPVCRYFESCGGCKWQHVSYEAQCEAKRLSVAEALEHHGGLAGLDVKPTVPAQEIYHYRNKMEFSFGARRWLTSREIASGASFDKRFALGLHAPGRYDQIIDIHECHLQSHLSVRLVNRVRELARTAGWEPWDVRTQQGFLRHLVLRQPARVEEMMVNLVTTWFEESRMALVADLLREEFPEVTTFVNTINSGVAQTAFGDEEFTIFGPGVVHDRIGRFTFEISASAFFQTNTVQAEKLYEVATESAELGGDDLVYDLYCGAGTISLFVSDRARHVVGVELIEGAVRNAEANAKANGVANCTFVEGDLLKAFTTDFVRAHGRPDVLIVDPPRGGMHPRVVRRIGELKPDRFVYVSCNPLTQARDLKMLADSYQVEAVQPVDLFPHTHHIENVVKLRARA